MGGLQHCFDYKLSDKKSKMKRLVNTSDKSPNITNNSGKGKLFSWKNIGDKNNNSDDEKTKNNSNIKVKKKVKKREGKNLSVDKKNHRKKSYDINSEKKSKKWEKLEKLGEGRFGEIYSCMRLSGGQNHTVKIYNKINETQKKRGKRPK